MLTENAVKQASYKLVSISSVCAGDRIIRKTAGGQRYLAIVLDVENDVPSENPYILERLTRVTFSPIGKDIVATVSGPSHLRLEVVNPLCKF